MSAGVDLGALADGLVEIQSHVLELTEAVRRLVDQRDEARTLAGELARALEGMGVDTLSVERQERLGRAWLAIPKSWWPE